MDSAPINGLIYQAVYIGIFIAATTITINLFTTINSYTEDVSDVVRGDSLSEVVSENEAVNIEELQKRLEKYTISGYEVYTIVNNYGIATNDNVNSGYNFGKKYNGADTKLGYFVKVYDNKANLVTNQSSINLTAEFTVDKSEIENGIIIFKQN